MPFLYVIIIFYSILSIISFLILAKLSNYLGLVDKPSDRKIHKEYVPSIGGVSILVCIWILYLFLNDTNYELNINFIILSSLIFIIGITDDVFDLNPYIRLFSLCFIVLIYLIIEKNLIIVQLNFSYLGSIVLTEYFSYLFSVLCFALYINSMNMMDGQNGLSGCLFLSVIIFLIFKNPQLIFETDAIFFLLISIIIFLFFNFRGKIFFGDSGIYFISTFIACYLIESHNKLTLLADEIFLILMIPGLDMLRLFVHRIANGKNPFAADKNHLHHILIRKFGQVKSLITIIILNIQGILLISITNIPNYFVIMFSMLIYFLILNLNKKFIIE